MPEAGRPLGRRPLITHFDLTWDELTTANRQVRTIATSEDTAARAFLLGVLDAITTYVLNVEETIAETGLSFQTTGSNASARIGSFREVGAISWALDFDDFAQARVAGRKLLEELAQSVQEFDRLVLNLGNPEILDAWQNRAGEVWERVARAESLRELDELRLAAQESAAQTAESSENAREAAGDTADAELSAHFDKLAKAEFKSMWGFRVLTFIFAALAAALSMVFYFDPAHLRSSEAVAPDWADTLVRSLAVVALGALAAYASRVASHHREVGVWAKTIGVQLLTLKAFLDPVRDSVTKDEIRAVVAARAFGAAPQSAAEMTDASALLANMVAARTQRSTDV